MSCRLVLDTHILLRMLFEPRRLSREQIRLIQQAQARGQTLGISALTLVEIALLVSDGRFKLNTTLAEFLEDLEANPDIEILPVTCDVALEIARLRVLRDPFDRAIAATAGAHDLTLVTSDQRIIDSGLVPVIG